MDSGHGRRCDPEDTPPGGAGRPRVRLERTGRSERTTDEVGPIIAGDHAAVRRHSTGTYRGGMPGVPPEAVGRRIDFKGIGFKGIDFKGIGILRARDGMPVEFRIGADMSVLTHRPGVRRA